MPQQHNLNEYLFYLKILIDIKMKMVKKLLKNITKYQKNIILILHKCP